MILELCLVLLPQFGGLWVRTQRLMPASAARSRMVSFPDDRSGFPAISRSAAARSSSIRALSGCEVTMGPSGRRGVPADALLREGASLAVHGNAEAAVACFEQVAVRFPGTTYARDAEQHIREIREKFGI